MDSFIKDPTGPIFAKKDGKYGYLCRYDGSIVIPFQFTGYCDQSAFCDGYPLGDNIDWSDDGNGHKQVHVLLRAGCMHRMYNEKEEGRIGSSNENLDSDEACFCCCDGVGVHTTCNI